MIITSVAPYSEEVLEYCKACYESQDFGYNLQVNHVQDIVFRKGIPGECHGILLYLEGRVPDCRVYQNENEETNYILFGKVKVSDLEGMFFDKMSQKIHAI